MAWVYLDEYTTAGVIQQSVMVSAMRTNSPSSSSAQFTVPASWADPAAMYGQLTRSPLGYYVTLAGFSVAAGNLPSAASIAWFKRRALIGST